MTKKLSTRFRDGLTGLFISAKRAAKLSPKRVTEVSTNHQLPWWARLDAFGRPIWLARLDIIEIAREIDVATGYQHTSRSMAAAKRIKELLNNRAEGWVPTSMSKGADV